MKTYIGDRIVGTAMSAFRRNTVASQAITRGPVRRPAVASKAVGPPVVIEFSLIRVVINLSR